MKSRETMNWPVYFMLLIAMLTLLMASAIGNGRIPFSEPEPFVVHEYAGIDKVEVRTEFVELPRTTARDLLETANTMVVRQ